LTPTSINQYLLNTNQVSVQHHLLAPYGKTSNDCAINLTGLTENYHKHPDRMPCPRQDISTQCFSLDSDLSGG